MIAHWNCDRCNFTSVDPVHFTSHQARVHHHEAGPPHTCSQCGTAFHGKKQLEAHLELTNHINSMVKPPRQTRVDVRSLEGLEKFNCPFPACGLGYYKHASLLMHWCRVKSHKPVHV
jgi:hypothetical protein